MGIPLNIDPNKRSFELYDNVDYKIFWSGWQQYKLNQAEHAVMQNLLPASGRRLIDIGCGYGRLSDSYLGRFQQVVMFDGSMSLLREARKNTGGLATYVAGDLHHLPFRIASFDCISMVRVFHHVTNSIACLSELHRVLSGGGRLVFTFRNKLYLMNVLRWLIHPTPDRPFSLEPSGIGTTLISHHPAYVRQYLHQAGFNDLRYQGVGVMDRLANSIGPFGKYAPTGKRSAHFFGKIKIAPWIFCSAVAQGDSHLFNGSDLENLLLCLICKNDLIEEENGYKCSSCGHFYPINEGIIDFRLT